MEKKSPLSSCPLLAHFLCLCLSHSLSLCSLGEACVNGSLFLCVCLSLSLSLCLFVCLSIYLSVSLSHTLRLTGVFIGTPCQANTSPVPSLSVQHLRNRHDFSVYRKLRVFVSVCGQKMSSLCLVPPPPTFSFPLGNVSSAAAKKDTMLGKHMHTLPLQNTPWL